MTSRLLRRPTPSELGCDVTVAIAAFSAQAPDRIVTASDRRLSYGESLPSTDDAILKNMKIAFRWGVLFAATDVTAFQPVHEELIKKMGFANLANFDVDHVRESAAAAYEKEFNKRFSQENLVQLGYKNISEFRVTGLQELGKSTYDDLIKKLMTFDIGLELLIYGFDSTKRPHIIEVTNPGKVADYDNIGYAAIGSGSIMARASLNRKAMRGDLDQIIFRVLDAKFLSENIRDVGKATHLFTLNSAGKFGMTRNVDKVRTIWDKINERPEPKSALEVIRTMHPFTALSREPSAE
jgi:hypothetical protein